MTPDRRLAVAIGFFDGVHTGHQAVFGELLSVCANQGYTPGVVTFPNHPRTLLTGEPVPLLTQCDEKCQLIARLGVLHQTVLPFNEALQQLSAEQFVQRILVDDLNVAHVVVGHDFHFGANRSGNGDVLTRLGQAAGFDVTVVPPFILPDLGVVSSRNIRERLSQGDVCTAETMLGRPYSVTGTVVKGRQLGRQLGIPTANIQIPADRLLPANGVYAVRVALAGYPERDAPLNAVANIGYRPTVGNTQAPQPLLEVHLLDGLWEPDSLYDQVLTVHFIRHLRPEQRFNGVEALAAQIRQDIDQTRTLLYGT